MFLGQQTWLTLIKENDTLPHPQWVVGQNYYVLLLIGHSVLLFIQTMEKVTYTLPCSLHTTTLEITWKMQAVISKHNNKTRNRVNNSNRTCSLHCGTHIHFFYLFYFFTLETYSFQNWHFCTYKYKNSPYLDKNKTINLKQVHGTHKTVVESIAKSNCWNSPLFLCPVVLGSTNYIINALISCF